MSKQNQSLSVVDVLHLCRHFGVKRFKNSSMELEFNDGLPQMQPQEVVVSPEAAKPPTKDEAYEQMAFKGLDEPKRGQDGLTAEQQRDFYNKVVDPELR